MLSFLRRHEVPFVLRHHSPVLSAADLAASEHLPPDMVAKSIAFAADHDYALAVVPGSWQIDLNKLQTITGKDDVRLLTEAELTFVFPDCELGALHPFGNLYQLPVFVDSALAEARNLAFHAGTHTDAVYLTYADYVKAVKPVVADIKQHVVAGESFADGSRSVPISVTSGYGVGSPEMRSWKTARVGRTGVQLG